MVLRKVQLDDYKGDLQKMVGLTNEEYVAQLRRKSSGFSRGASNYRGVTKCVFRTFSGISCDICSVVVWNSNE